MDLTEQVPLAEMAELLGISAERIRQLAKLGYIAQTVRGKVPLGAAVRGYIKSLRDDIKRNSGTESAARLQDERARMLALKREQLEGSLIPLEEHIAIGDATIGALRTNLATLPSRLSSDPAERRRIEDIVDETLRDAAAQLEKLANEPPPPGDAPPSKPEDDAG